MEFPSKSQLKPCDQLENYGRRIRIRSEQQRQNRKEIKVIDTCLVDRIKKQQTKNGKSSKNLDNNNSVIREISLKKRQHRKHHKLSNIRSKKTRVNKKTAQIRKSPDLSQISTKISTDSQSKYVQLHELPVGTSYETLKFFFTGLSFRRVLLLLSNRTEIPALDPSSSFHQKSQSNLREFVYTNRDLRVLVEFDSISEALLARDRSKEIIFTKHLDLEQYSERNEQDNEDNRVDPPDGFSIGVSIVPRHLALLLSNYVSFEAIPGVTLHSYLSKTESNMKPLVRAILWTKIQQECNVAVDNVIKNANLNILSESVGNLNPTLPNYQLFANHYNRMNTIYDDMLMNIPPDDYDEAMFSVDPLIRLTTQACSVLDNEMKYINKFLYQVQIYLKNTLKKNSSYDYNLL